MIISVSGGKGGTGKSMVATSLAIEFSKIRKTLLVDADVECPNDHLILNAKLKKISKVTQVIPKWDLKKCTKCGLCAEACKKDAIIFVKGKYPAFVKNMCIGCGACIPVCPTKAISSSKKDIGLISAGSRHGVELITGELILGELASGEIVSELRSKASEYSKKIGAEVQVIDSAAGIGCPVIASLKGADFIVAVTEPTPSALHDLKRVVYLSESFKIPCGIIINKHDLEPRFCKKIISYAKSKNIFVLGKIPYNHDFVKATIKMKPITILNPGYQELFRDIARLIEKEIAASSRKS